MREIKFRAWGKSNKTYTYVTLGDLICGACTESGDKKLSGNTQIWEEGTGIKDKNGREIYEGDIISSHNGDIIGKISQHESGEWQIEWIGVYGGESKLYDHRKLCEVVGNIHDNKELLEDKTKYERS